MSNTKLIRSYMFLCCIVFNFNGYVSVWICLWLGKACSFYAQALRLPLIGNVQCGIYYTYIYVDCDLCDIWFG